MQTMMTIVSQYPIAAQVDPVEGNGSAGERNWKLPERLPEYSEADTYVECVREWRLINVEQLKGDDSDYCLCSKKIHQVMTIKNIHNGNTVKLGNRCIKQIKGPGSQLEDAHLVAAGLQRITEDVSAAANPALIKYAKARGFLSQKDCRFLAETCRKRSLTDKQENYRQLLNRRIIQQKKAPKPSKKRPRAQRAGFLSTVSRRTNTLGTKAIVQRAVERGIFSEENKEFYNKICFGKTKGWNFSPAQKKYFDDLTQRLSQNGLISESVKRKLFE